MKAISPYYHIKLKYRTSKWPGRAWVGGERDSYLLISQVRGEERAPSFETGESREKVGTTVLVHSSRCVCSRHWIRHQQPSQTRHPNSPWTLRHPTRKHQVPWKTGTTATHWMMTSVSSRSAFTIYQGSRIYTKASQTSPTSIGPETMCHIHLLFSLKWFIFMI